MTDNTLSLSDLLRNDIDHLLSDDATYSILWDESDLDYYCISAQ